MTEKTIKIEQAQIVRILAALRSVTVDLRDLMDNGFPKPPRKNCNADAGSAYENWWDDKRVCLEVADEVLRDLEGLA